MTGALERTPSFELSFRRTNINGRQRTQIVDFIAPKTILCEAGNGGRDGRIVYRLKQTTPGRVQQQVPVDGGTVADKQARRAALEPPNRFDYIRRGSNGICGDTVDNIPGLSEYRGIHLVFTRI
jgi:hypothetical protein